MPVGALKSVPFGSFLLYIWYNLDTIFGVFEVFYTIERYGQLQHGSLGCMERSSEAVFSYSLAASPFCSILSECVGLYRV